MNIALKSLGLLMLLVLSVASKSALSAEPFFGGEHRQTFNLFAQYDQRDARREQQQQRREDVRQWESYGRDSRGRNDGGGSEAQRGRMSPEERRDLRRQIDEAGHDIYSRKQRQR